MGKGLAPKGAGGPAGGDLPAYCHVPIPRPQTGALWSWAPVLPRPCWPTDLQAVQLPPACRAVQTLICFLQDEDGWPRIELTSEDSVPITCDIPAGLRGLTPSSRLMVGLGPDWQPPDQWGWCRLDLSQLPGPLGPRLALGGSRPEGV